MTLSVRSVFLIVSVVLFALGAIGVSSGRFSLMSAGLAFFAASFLAG